MSRGEGEAFTLLTMEPGPDVAPIHNRQMVVLERRIGWPGSTSPGRKRGYFVPCLRGR
jgi:hypothetical protein